MKNLTSLKYEKNKAIVNIILNRPDSSNSINYEMIDELVTSLDQTQKDSDVRVVVLTGEGKNFCSGGDIKNMLSQSEMFQGESNELRERYEQGIQRISKAMEAFSKPVIAMVNGAAAGAGCDLACMCDLRIGSEESLFLESFAKIGLVPGDGGTFFLQRVVGYAKALEMSLTARGVKGEEALRIGLLNSLVKREELEAETMRWAVQISLLPPVAVQMIKKSMKVAYLHDLNTSLDLLAAYQGIAQRTADHFEALQASVEKRAPQFTGR